MNISPNADEFRQILREEIEKISSPRQIAFLNSILIEPYHTRLVWALKYLGTGELTSHPITSHPNRRSRCCLSKR